jgi:hypothetical protein
MKKMMSIFFIFAALGIILPSLTFAKAELQEVQVVNTENEPIPVYNVDEYDISAKQPFQEGFQIQFDPTQSGGGVSIPVPPGKRLVIEFVSGVVSVTIGKVATFFVKTTVNGNTAKHFLQPIETEPSGGNYNWTVSQNVRLYADPQTDVQIFTNFTQSGSGAFFSISGYLMDLP